MKYGTSKNTLIIIKSIEELGWQDLVAPGHTQIPPLGTLNENLEHTYENDNSALATYLRSQGIRGGFEVLYGKVTMSFTEEPEKVDVQDLSMPKDYARGFDTYSGNLEMRKEEGNHRFTGAFDGGFDSENLVYYPWPQYRFFEIWTLEDVNVKTLEASECGFLTKHIGVILDRREMSVEAPFKLTFPLSRRMYRRFPDWSEPAQSTLLADDDLTGTPGTPTDPSMHTRLEMSVAGATTWDTVTVNGYNIYGEPITETITWTADGTKITKKYFDSIASLSYGASWAGSPLLNIKDFDYKIQ